MDPALCNPSNQLTCEAGDFSGKFGDFSAATNNDTYTDNVLSLFGSNSVVGRSVVIHRTDGSRLACATIGEDSLKVVTATFDGSSGGVVGTIRLFQNRIDPESDTAVLVDLRYVSAVAPATIDHNWHIHATPVGMPGDCASTGGHFNPVG